MKDNQKRKNLFIKVNIHKFLDRGLLAKLDPERTQTLIGLALFLPDCRPGESFLSRVFGLTQTSVSQRIRKLEKFRYKGKPIITVVRRRKKDGSFGVNRYRLHRNCGISIF